MPTPYIGQIEAFGFNFPPSGWAQCNGQLLAISSYNALFALLGTTYGGDGQTTFALPDLRGRVQLHKGTGPGLSTRAIGSKSGTESDVLTIGQMPEHNHAATLNAAVVASTDTDPTAKALGLAASNTYINNKANEAMNPGSVAIANTGNNSPVTDMQPYLTINWCIALFGIFPSQN